MNIDFNKMIKASDEHIRIFVLDFIEKSRDSIHFIVHQAIRDIRWKIRRDMTALLKEHNLGMKEEGSDLLELGLRLHVFTEVSDVMKEASLITEQEISDRKESL